MTSKPPKLISVPTSLWAWPDLETTAKIAFLSLWIRSGGRGGVVQFRPFELAISLGRRQARRVPDWLNSLTEVGLIKIHSQTEYLVTAELFDPDAVAVEQGLQSSKRQKRKLEVPESILSHSKLSAEAKLSWISIWNQNGCQPCVVQFHLRALAHTIGRDHERGARRWWSYLQQYGFATEVSVDRGKITAKMNDPKLAAALEAKLQMAAARK